MNDENIGMFLRSRLCDPYKCRNALDFTYFQTIVTVASNDVINSFTISFTGMDDGSRVTVFNSAYPNGLVVPGSFVTFGGSGTTDLKQYLIVGQNRVVITQVDDCCSGNNLGAADVVINSIIIDPTPLPNDGCTCYSSTTTSASVSGDKHSCICFSGNNNDCN